jgi:hypothetical protein
MDSVQAPHVDVEALFEEELSDYIKFMALQTLA